MELFCKELPKIELHAHLNGSLNTKSIYELGGILYGNNKSDFVKKIANFKNFHEGCNSLENVFQKFEFIHKLTSTIKGLQLVTEFVIRDFAQDNVIYLELRTTPKSNEWMSKKQYLEVIIDTIQRCTIIYNILVKLLISIDRSKCQENANEVVDLAITLHQKYPNIVKGIDLSGNPKKGKFKDFIMVLGKAKSHKLNVALHCAEIDNWQEAQDMLDFGFERCGHGTFLTNEQFDQCFNQNITIECCLTSNIKCKTVKSYSRHHFSTLFAKNYKVVLCTDDCGLFDTTLSREFISAVKYLRLNSSDIYRLSIKSIDACFADSHEKEDMKGNIDTYFEEKYKVSYMIKNFVNNCK